MNTKSTSLAVALAGVVLLPSLSSAQILYSQDFEAAPPSTSGNVAFGGFGQLNNISGTGWQIQGGGGGGGISVNTGVDSSGVAFSQGLYANWDHSAASSFTFNQETIYGGIGAPGLGTPLAAISIQMDIFISGSATSTPLGINFQNNGSEWVFTPTLTEGDYTHVSFTADLGSLQAGTGVFDPTLSSNLRIQFGAGGGFGFDANNIVTLDNILVTSVPEPGSLMLLGLGATALLFRRRRS